MKLSAGPIFGLESRRGSAAIRDARGAVAHYTNGHSQTHTFAFFKKGEPLGTVRGYSEPVNMGLRHEERIGSFVCSGGCGLWVGARGEGGLFGL